MTQFETVEEILDFAIKEEEGAYQFYSKMAEKVDKPWMKKVFESFAQEEQGHKEKLVNVKKGKIVLTPTPAKVQDLKIADYVVEAKPSEDMDYSEALVVAMKKEKAAFRLYSNLAERVEDEKLKELFLGLAHEEANHKLRFEVEYDEYVLIEN